MSAQTSGGRRAQTKGVSMHPHELDDVRTIEELTTTAQDLASLYAEESELTLGE